MAKQHARVSNIRKDALHQLTSDLTRRFHSIGIEDLNVKAMMSNRHVARSIADMGVFEFRRQLDYKAGMRGAVVVVADRWSTRLPRRRSWQANTGKTTALPMK